MEHKTLIVSALVFINVTYFKYFLGFFFSKVRAFGQALLFETRRITNCCKQYILLTHLLDLTQFLIVKLTSVLTFASRISSPSDFSVL